MKSQKEKSIWAWKFFWDIKIPNQNPEFDDLATTSELATHSSFGKEILQKQILHFVIYCIEKGSPEIKSPRRFRCVIHVLRTSKTPPDHP